MSKVCYNPYHFVPTPQRGEIQRRYDLERNSLRDDEAAGSTTHERYVPGAHSGRLTCRLLTKTPLVVGAHQERRDRQMAIIEPYRAKGRPAIPGSSLRGLIGSLVEAASNSTMRVLTAGRYSYRKPFDPKFTLSAIGLIVRDAAGGALQLKPVALPTLERATDRNGRYLNYFVVPPRFRRIFPRPALKVYVGDYREIRVDKGLRTSRNERETYNWTVRELSYNSQGGLDEHSALHCKPNPHNAKFAVAQLAERDVPERKGLMRVLGCWPPRTDHVPEGKKHELWLPLPGPDVKALRIHEKAIERFRDLADERTEDSLKAGNPVMPFHPLETARNEDPREFGQKFRLKAGDLVYFDVNEQGVVTEIALASIWRGRVETADGKPAGAAQFFEAVDTDLVPFHPGRQRITIAERMFGFVEEGKEGDSGLALASRIRFSDALLKDDVSSEQALEQSPVALRILSSPKPPCPALYFKSAKSPNRWIGKHELLPGEHHPQGRKMYLHHHVEPDKQPWETKDPSESADQKNLVRPVRSGQEFVFHVDFDNLSDGEMGLLLYALAPDNEFHHKLGMGKPLGLGSVKVEVIEWQEVDRQSRYSPAGLRGSRYAVVRRAGEPVFWKLRDAVITSGLVPREIHKAICVLGSYRGAPRSADIHTPTLADQLDAEGETFKWFVANDNGLTERDRTIPKQRKHLVPLPEAGKLVTLDLPEWQPRMRR